MDASADEVAAVFGREILGSDGKVDRKKLGAIVFDGAKCVKTDKFTLADSEQITQGAGFHRREPGAQGAASPAREIKFSPSEARAKLEAILHPKIHAEIYARAGALERTKTPYFVDIPLFFERGNYEFDEVCVVYAPEPLLIKRVIKRNNLSEEAVKSRLAAQMPIEQKRALATYVIDNSGDLKALTDRVATLAQTIKEKYANL